MKKRFSGHIQHFGGMAILLCLLLFVPLVTFAQEKIEVSQQKVMPVRRGQKGQVEVPDSGTVKSTTDLFSRSAVTSATGDTIKFLPEDSLRLLQESMAKTDPQLGKIRVYNPSPTRALWLSALCPGLGQIYNRRYWKLPIIVGAFVGLGYGTAWNNKMYKDYTKGYRDLTDNDPNTKSYMDFFPPTTKESDLDVTWLKKTFKNKRTYYRRYRDICVFSIIAVYLLNVIDAYVDASLAHFDISDNLAMDVAPAAIVNGSPGTQLPSLGLQCAISF